MQSVYKIELFDRQMNFRSMAVIESPIIYFDYLTLEGMQVTAPLLPVQKGDIAHITDDQGDTVYQGIVSDVELDKTVTLSLQPLLSLFDLTVSYDRTDLQAGALEDFIAGIITELYITNTDALQLIPMTVQTTSSTINTALNIKSNVHELYDIITKAFTMYGVRVSAEFLPQTKMIVVTIGTVTATEKVVEAHLDNVLEKSIIIGDSYGQVNKLTLINKYDEGERITYYLHPDGSIDTTDANRIVPVFPAVEYVESEDFPTDAHTRARETLSQQMYDNLIELTYHKDDRLVAPGALEIGTPVQVIDKDAAYNTILTGYERTGQTVKLICGNVRVDLTKKLILERRKSIA